MNAPDLDHIARAHVVAPHPDDEAIGAFGLEPRPFTLPRILAALCLLAGVVLSRF